MAQISHCVRRAITTLFIDNPPIHALSSQVVEELHKKLEELEKQQSTEAVILMGKNGIFSAGADINEFTQMRFGNTTDLELVDLISRLDSFKKPIVAFIQRYAFGGGLEVALGCHYRLAEVGSKVGFPEVKIGLIPGAQGTQRLPRLIGPRRAMEMAVWGNPISAEKALEYGVIDKLISPAGEGSMDAVYDFVESVKGKPIPLKRRLSQIPVAIPENDSVEKIVADTQRAMGKNMHGALAPVCALKAVRAAMECSSFEAGVAKEKELFSEVLTSGQSAALQYAFQASRRAMKLPKDVASAVPIRVSTIGVVGGGTMGQGIAATFLTSGFSVRLLERDSEAARRAEQAILRIVDGSKALGRVRKIGKLLVSTDAREALGKCDLVVEAVWEDMALKKNVFALMDKVCPAHTMLCSNTSTLDIDTLAVATGRPEKVIGSHFFVPAYHMRPLEIVRGAKTSPETLVTLHSVARAIGKVPYTVGNCFGFVGNRMLFALIFEAAASLMEGSAPEAIDDALEMFGMTIGPFKTMDLAGMDVLDLVFNNMLMSTKQPPTGAIVQFVDAISHFVHKCDRKGRKTGAGWYKYERPGGKIPTPDPELEQLIEPFRCPEGRQPPAYNTQPSDQEVVDRCVFAMVNEGFKILEEGVANTPETIDAMMLQGYGWPQVLGGPMYYASVVGLKNVLAKVEKRYSETGSPYLKPSILLQRIVKTKDPNALHKWARLGKL